MPEFLTLLTPPQALETLLANVPQWVESDEGEFQEILSSSHALGRVIARAVTAPENLPPFDRSTVDGFAVRAVDTHGASESLPGYLRVIGEVLMGAEAGIRLSTGECALIHTGGMLPQGADAVIMVEQTQRSREGEIELLKAVAAGENTLKTGEDVGAGEVVIPAGTRLRPAEIGGLMGLGITQIAVWKPPRTAILSTGDEVIPPSSQLQPGQVRDVNSYALGALIEQSGGKPVLYGIIPDQKKALEEAARQALAENDLVIIAAGSSASTRDLTAEVINNLGQPGVLVHGINVRPGKPTILAVCQNKAVIGLPGNPVSALVIAGLFAVPVIKHLIRMFYRQIPSQVPAKLSVNLASQSGREDWIPVRLVESQDGWVAQPVFGKSNLIFSLVRADGLVTIPADATGLAAGSPVNVILM